MADLSLDISGEGYIDRLETKIESPTAETVSPQGLKTIQTSLNDSNEGTSVDKDIDDNELKDEAWIDHCETKISSDGELISLRMEGNNAVTNIGKPDQNGNVVTDSKKTKKVGSYEITSASSFCLSDTKKSKDSSEMSSNHTSPVKINQKEVSMLYQMGVEAIGKPVQEKHYEESQLQHTLDEADGQMKGDTMATEDSRKTAKAGWASIRQESGEVENYLVEEDDDENVIISLGAEFEQDTTDDLIEEEIATAELDIQETDNVQVESAGVSFDARKHLAQAEDFDIQESANEKTNKTASDKLSQLENALSSFSQENSTKTVEQERRAHSIEKQVYKAEVSAESRMSDSKIENHQTQEDKALYAQSNLESQIKIAGQENSSHLLNQQSIKKPTDKNVIPQTQEQLTDEKINEKVAMEKTNLLSSYKVNDEISSVKNVHVSNCPESSRNSTQIQVERKFKISNDCRQKLMDIGAKLAKEIQFTDKYFDDIKYKITLSDSWLRQRNHIWEFKIPPRFVTKKDTSSLYTETRSDKEIVKHLSKMYSSLKSAEDLNELVTELGLETFATFTTTRQIFHLPSGTVYLDATDFGMEIGKIEVFVSDKSRITEALDIIDDLAKSLGAEPLSCLQG